MKKCAFRLAALIAFSLCGVPSGAAATHAVDIVDDQFVPANLTVRVGDTVTWTQKGSDTHTTTSGMNGVPDGYWNSGNMTLTSNTTFSYTFAAAGGFPYFCIPHSGFMTGRITVEAVDPNAPPTVSITAPPNNTTLQSGSSVTIEATASDSDGTITVVEFFDGTLSLGTDTASPFSVTVNLAQGTHVLTAKATDDDAAATISAAVSVTVTTGGGTRIDDPIPERIAKGGVTIELELVVDGLIAPLGLAAPDDGSGRLFVYDQAGKVWIVHEGQMLPEPLLDVTGRLVALGDYDERGLLGFATHPQFGQQPLVYTYTSEPLSSSADFTVEIPPDKAHNHQSVIAEWRIDSANSNRVDVASRRELLRIDQPQSNHNAGTMRFGPDGLLYIALGDGGAADDQGDGHVPDGNAQQIENIYGSVIRIDVHGSNSANGRYGVPTDNPFVGKDGVDEIFAYGFRNPYSFSFDKENGALYVGDVGQNHVEEVDQVIKGGNYGWNVKEGSFFFDPNGTDKGFVTTAPVREVPPDLQDPFVQYDHDEGTAVIGGSRYRGSQIPELAGAFIAGDWGTFEAASGRLFYLADGGGAQSIGTFKEFRIGTEDRPFGNWLKGFGEDQEGELYVFGSQDLGPKGTTGKMFKLIASRAAELRITSIAAAGDNVTINWSGGTGPFMVQKKASLTDPIWMTAATTTERTATVPATTAIGFFRVADLAAGGSTAFTVFLSGAAERPDPVETTATGTGTLVLEGNMLRFDIQYSGLSGPATAAHIHGPAGSSEATNVLISLAPFNGGAFGASGTLSGSVTLTAEQRQHVLSGRTYVNVHTEANGGGEIRGQVAPVVFRAQLTGEAERPDPVTTDASGTGTFLLVANQLTFNVTYSGLSTIASGAHIHGPATVSEATNVLVNLAPFNGGGFATNGSLSGTVTLTPQQIGHLVDGLTYINVHSAIHGSGEIRGQLTPDTDALAFTASLSGAAERPNPVDTLGSGTGIFVLDGHTLHFDVAYSGLGSTATAAHIHGPASTSTATNVLVSLASFAGAGFDTNGTLSGSVMLTAEQKVHLLTGKTYVNIHTEPNGGGEIRGQLAPLVFRAHLSGAAERPDPVETSGIGTGTLLLRHNKLWMNVTYSGLSGAATAAHIHGPSTIEGSAGVLVGLASVNGGAFGASGSLAGNLDLTPEHLGHVVDGMTYINFHTDAHNQGEIRGQILP